MQIRKTAINGAIAYLKSEGNEKSKLLLLSNNRLLVLPSFASQCEGHLTGSVTISRMYPSCVLFDHFGRTKKST